MKLKLKRTFESKITVNKKCEVVVISVPYRFSNITTISGLTAGGYRKFASFPPRNIIHKSFTEAIQLSIQKPWQGEKYKSIIIIRIEIIVQCENDCILHMECTLNFLLLLCGVLNTILWFQSEKCARDYLHMILHHNWPRYSPLSIIPATNEKLP